MTGIMKGNAWLVGPSLTDCQTQRHRPKNYVWASFPEKTCTTRETCPGVSQNLLYYRYKFCRSPGGRELRPQPVDRTLLSSEEGSLGLTKQYLCRVSILSDLLCLVARQVLKGWDSSQGWLLFSEVTRRRLLKCIKAMSILNFLGRKSYQGMPPLPSLSPSLLLKKGKSYFEQTIFKSEIVWRKW